MSYASNLKARIALAEEGYSRLLVDIEEGIPESRNGTYTTEIGLNEIKTVVELLESLGFIIRLGQLVEAGYGWAYGAQKITVSLPD